jgi:hypothetical protein
VQCGISFLRALSEKYIEQLHGVESQETVVLGSSQGTIQVEAVGLDKVRSRLSRLERLKVVSLDGTLVAYPDPHPQIRNTCSSTLDFTALALDENALCRHQASECLISHLPLYLLGVSSHRLPPNSLSFSGFL